LEKNITAGKDTYSLQAINNSGAGMVGCHTQWLGFSHWYGISCFIAKKRRMAEIFREVDVY
jgi:hypothetical protein